MSLIFITLTLCSVILAFPTGELGPSYTVKCGEEECVLQGSIEIREENIIGGDILLPDSELIDRNRAVIRHKSRKWPNATVPFLFHEVFTKYERKQVLNAMKVIQSRTCIKFTPADRKNPPDSFVGIVDEAEICSSVIGKVGGITTVNLNRQKCLPNKGILQHELLHALGAEHEHTRPDRDKYITIVYSNIEPNLTHNFDVNSAADFTTFGHPYNYESIMHYHPYAGAIDPRKRTILVKDPRARALRMGQRGGMNDLDFEMLNKLYCKH